MPLVGEGCPTKIVIDFERLSQVRIKGYSAFKFGKGVSENIKCIMLYFYVLMKQGLSLSTWLTQFIRPWMARILNGSAIMKRYVST